jgi:ketopantoate reductase
VLKGRRTEVEYLNGYVSQQGTKAGIRTPFCDAIVKTVTSYPVGTLKPDKKNLAPLVAMLR